MKDVFLLVSLFCSFYIFFCQVLLLLGIRHPRHDRIFSMVLLFVLFLWKVSTVLDFYVFYFIQMSILVLFGYFVFQFILLLKHKIVVAIKQYIRYNDKW